MRQIYKIIKDFPKIDLCKPTLKQAIMKKRIREVLPILGQELFLSTVFVAGVLSFLSPCIIPVLPVYFSIFSKGVDTDTKMSPRSKLIVIFNTLLFVAGISTTFVLLGFGAGKLSGIINNRYFLTFAGAIVIILGIHQMGLINFKILNFERRISSAKVPEKGFFSSYLLGLTFSFGWTPCIGPILAGVLGIAASANNPLWGGILMAAYSLGFAVPLLIIAIFADSILSKIGGLNKHLGKLKTISGVIIVIMGVLLMTDSVNRITVFFQNMFTG